MQPKTDFLQARRSRGFTLIELVIVLIIIGVLAAVAAPRFIDFSDDAEEAAVQSQANALTAANSINVAACALNKTGPGECQTIDETSCANAASLVNDFNSTRFDLRDTSGAGPEAAFSLTGTDPGDVGDTATCFVGLQ